MTQRIVLILLLALASVLVGCDKFGVYPLGLDKDVVSQCAVQSTWVRSIEFMNEDDELVIATEVFIIGVEDVSTFDPQSLDEEGVCFNFARVEIDSNTKMWSGRMLQNEAGALEASIEYEYTFAYEPEKDIIWRKGASRKDFEDAPLAMDLDFELDGTQLLLTYDGEQRRLTRLGDVIARLDPSETDPEALGGPKDIYRMFNLALFVGQPRIPGFGGTGMTKYSERSDFTALISGAFAIWTQNLADVFIEYYACEEIEGVFIDGLQITYANLQGEGTMKGVLSVDFYSDPTSETPYFSATVDYKDLIIDNGVAGAGTYTLTVGGNDHVLPYSMATDEDFNKSGLLPIAEGVP